MRRLLPRVAAVLLFVFTRPIVAEPPAYTSEQLSLIRSTAECQLSPDGKTVAFVSDITGALELWTVAVTGGWPHQLTNLNEQVSDIRWSPDSQWLIFASDDGGNERRDLYRVPASGGAVEQLTETSRSESAPRISPDGQRLAFTADPDREFLFQLHVLDLETRRTVPLTQEPVNVLIPVWSWDGKTMAITRSGDDQKGELLLVKPRVNRLGAPPPAVVAVHGGPNAQHMMAFNPFIPILTEGGFAVIAPNYRGSTGYGKAFEDANNHDWGGGDLKDLTAAVQSFGQRGDIDLKRVGIMGGSYGGYLTLMALAKTPEVWSAGVEWYGMPDLVMDYLLTKSRFGDEYETEMGNPKANAARFRERSPLPYLDDIKAPLLIFQGANDSNVPKSESDLLVAVLKALKKPHEYIVYDDEGHGFTKRKNLLDHYRRTVVFFTQHLKSKN